MGKFPHEFHALVQKTHHRTTSTKEISRTKHLRTHDRGACRERPTTCWQHSAALESQTVGASSVSAGNMVPKEGADGMGNQGTKYRHKPPCHYVHGIYLVKHSKGDAGRSLHAVNHQDQKADNMKAKLRRISCRAAKRKETIGMGGSTTKYKGAPNNRATNTSRTFKGSLGSKSLGKRYRSARHFRAWMEKCCDWYMLSNQKERPMEQQRGRGEKEKEIERPV